MFCNNCNVLLHAAMTKAGLEDDCDACGGCSLGYELRTVLVVLRVDGSCLLPAPTLHAGPDTHSPTLQTTPRKAPPACRRRRWRRCRCLERWTSSAVSEKVNTIRSVANCCMLEVPLPGEVDFICGEHSRACC